MKLNLFLSVLSLFAVLHLSKAGPLRLHKRAAFYIANETACVVDNIVYSNGDPIPTDDPCEACKCRPPGFACVLKECKAKPGCKAVRRVGQCCPEYVCGCEHNGRMFRDGEEIRDPKNPCYECHCQGSSIACAFVDCIFLDDCDTVYVPGECCPQYKNCSRDVPERNQFPGGNALPPVNLLPALYDESVLPADFPSVSRTRKPTETSAEPTQLPTQPPTPSDSNEESLAQESKEPTALTSRPQTTDSVNIDEDSKLDPEGSDEEVKAFNEDSLKSETDFEKEYVKVSEETKPLFNSETEIKEADSDTLTEIKIDPTTSSVEEIKAEEPQTTVSNELVEDENEEVLAKSPENEPISTQNPENEPASSEISENEPSSTQIPESEKQVKNSAAENAKSLKLSGESLKDSQKDGDIENVDKLEKAVEKLDETVTESQLFSETHSESKPVSQETQTNAHTTPVYGSDKIKSESAETVTIVVHVKEKAKPSTEDDLVTEKVTPKPERSTTQDNLLKSNDKLQNTEVNKEFTTTAAVSSDKNFEIFASSSETNLEESTTTTSPLTEQPKEKPEERSDETDSTNKDLEKDSTSEERVLDLKNDIVTTTQNVNDVTEANKGVEASEVVEEIKASEPTVTVLRIDPNAPLKIEIITDYSATPEIEKQPNNESKKEETEETKSKEIVEGNPEVRDPESKPEEKVEDINVEGREDEPTADVKLEEATPEVKLEETVSETKLEETTPEIKLKETTSEVKLEEITSTEKVKESRSTEKLQETTPVEKLIETSQGERIEVTIPSEKVKEYASAEKSEETTPSEKVKESPPAEKLEVTTPTENLEKTSTEKLKEFTIAEKIKESIAEERIQETESKATTEETIAKDVDITVEEKNKSDEAKELKTQGTEE